MTNEELEKKWNKSVSKLIGKQIVGASYMTQKEADEWGWEKRALKIKFTDGTEMILSCDDEGNDGGSALTNIFGLGIIPTL